MSEWSVAEPSKLTFDEPVTALHVRIANGTVNVVGADEGSTRLEVSSIEGPPLMVTQESGTLTVAYEDLPRKGFLKWLDRRSWRNSAVISLAVPARTRVEVGVIGATAVVSGVEGPAVVKGVSGDTTLVGLSGPVRADTVSGNVEAQALTGDLHLNSVSGDLTVIEGSSPSVRVESISGSVVVDLDSSGRPSDISLTSISGEIAIRLPHPADAEVEVDSTSGTVSSAFENLRISGQWGAKKITGRLGAGNGRLKATTVSGSIALLRRLPPEDEPWDEGADFKNFRKGTAFGEDGPEDTVPDGGVGTGPERAGSEHIGPEHIGPERAGPHVEPEHVGPEHVGPSGSPTDGAAKPPTRGSTPDSSPTEHSDAGVTDDPTHEKGL
ncbi:DUF4097 family beta strand repeat-containing protein [Streptomyces sp. NBC_00878]|uniref:DUF4097 family beta strand repeat-containing protein n=1 Tax=Streptomyces sp. NBC_00878 TaxID=2975854 RepID=UPI00224F8988|nr:DUF4097 family beta strand repeat-containing protein [Streptomyces sp. NBC_00878]MCX4905502.1 DUF4097 family beta strand repeat-containing protein [Streptomyces sp. NBC_00878]